MKKIITIQVGQSGNKIGNSLIKEINDDCKGELDQNFFREKISRTLLVDSEPSTLDQIIAEQQSNFYDPNNFVCDKSGKYTHFSDGYYGRGQDFMEYIEDALRKEIEKSKEACNIQLIHSLSSGTGSGLGARISSHVSDAYYGRTLINFSLYPSKEDQNILNPYNSILSLLHFNYNFQLSFYFDNDSLQQICQNMLLQDQNYQTYNNLMGFTMNGLFRAFRMNCQPNTNLIKIETNLTPFPRLHCYTISLSPLQAQICNPSLELISKEIYHKFNQTYSNPIRQGKYLNQCFMVYGETDIFQLNQQFKKTINIQNIEFTKWIADQLTFSICPKKLNIGELMIFSINHHTSIGIRFNQLLQQFRALYNKRAYLHIFLKDGMDEMEFIEAESALGDVISEYCQYNESLQTTDE